MSPTLVMVIRTLSHLIFTIMLQSHSWELFSSAKIRKLSKVNISQLAKGGADNANHTTAPKAKPQASLLCCPRPELSSQHASHREKASHSS